MSDREYDWQFTLKFAVPSYQNRKEWGMEQELHKPQGLTTGVYLDDDLAFLKLALIRRWANENLK